MQVDRASLLPSYTIVFDACFGREGVASRIDGLGEHGARADEALMKDEGKPFARLRFRACYTMCPVPLLDAVLVLKCPCAHSKVPFKTFSAFLLLGMRVSCYSHICPVVCAWYLSSAGCPSTVQGRRSRRSLPTHKEE